VVVSWLWFSAIFRSAGWSEIIVHYIVIWRGILESDLIIKYSRILCETKMPSSKFDQIDSPMACKVVLAKRKVIFLIEKVSKIYQNNLRLKKIVPDFSTVFLDCLKYRLVF
jgi:hypothetical protein